MTDQPKTRYVVIDREGNVRGPFEGHGKAAHWATSRWPLQNQDPDRKDGWDIAVLHSPDE